MSHHFQLLDIQFALLVRANNKSLGNYTRKSPGIGVIRENKTAHVHVYMLAVLKWLSPYGFWYRSLLRKELCGALTVYVNVFAVLLQYSSVEAKGANSLGKGELENSLLSRKEGSARVGDEKGASLCLLCPLLLPNIRIFSFFYLGKLISSFTKVVHFSRDNVTLKCERNLEL